MKCAYCFLIDDHDPTCPTIVGIGSPGSLGGLKPAKPARAKNPCAKTRPQDNPYEVWADGSGWEWHVLKKWQIDDAKPYARWFCLVKSPIVPHGEMGDVYVSEIKSCAQRIK